MHSWMGVPARPPTPTGAPCPGLRRPPCDRRIRDAIYVYTYMFDIYIYMYVFICI